MAEPQDDRPTDKPKGTDRRRWLLWALVPVLIIGGLILYRALADDAQERPDPEDIHAAPAATAPLHPLT